LRVEDGEATLRTRKGLDWTEKFQAIASEASSLPDVLVDGEIVALDHNGAPDFSTLQAATFRRQAPTISFSSRSICCSPMEWIFAVCRSPSERRN
jgi:ATP-dependent DNA ligase